MVIKRNFFIEVIQQSEELNALVETIEVISPTLLFIYVFFKQLFIQKWFEKRKGIL